MWGGRGEEGGFFGREGFRKGMEEGREVWGGGEVWERRGCGVLGGGVEVHVSARSDARLLVRARFAGDGDGVRIP